MNTETETKPACLFEVGKIYPTRGGDDRIVVAIDSNPGYPIITRRSSGIMSGDVASHNLRGRVIEASVTAYDLIPPAPPKKRVPLGPEDVPPGSCVKPSHAGEHGWLSVLATGAPIGGVLVARHIGKDLFVYSFQGMHDLGWQIKRPGGEWLPCSKEVDA